VFPPGLNNAYLFALFNALSFQVVVNSPMVLYAKTLNASATVLGIITGMMPLLVIFQIPGGVLHQPRRLQALRFRRLGNPVMFISPRHSCL